MLRILYERGGVTLIEQLVALLLGSVMITALYAFYRTQLQHALAQETQTGTLEDARGALDIMVRDLKNAGAWASGSVPAETGKGDDPDADVDSVCNRVYAATAIKIHIQMDLNGNGTCADSDPNENVRYELTGPTATCPGATIIRRNGDCLVDNVTTPIPTVLFRYYGISGEDLGSTPLPAAIRRVNIVFGVRAKNPIAHFGGQIVSVISTSVELRNAAHD